MTLPRDEAQFLASLARDERKLLRQIFLLAADLVANGEEFSCNAISLAYNYQPVLLDIGALRDAYEALYLDNATSLAGQLAIAHEAQQDPDTGQLYGYDREAARDQRVFMLLFAREMVRTGDFE